MVRKALKAGVEIPKAQFSPGDKVKSNKGVGKGKSTTRKCATCGAIGHIRTKSVLPEPSYYISNFVFLTSPIAKHVLFIMKGMVVVHQCLPLLLYLAVQPRHQVINKPLF